MPLWRLEARTIPADAVGEGLLSARWAPWLTCGGALLLVGALWPAYGWLALVLALPLARMLALELTAYLLPHLYTLPLMALGVALYPDMTTVAVIVGLFLLREVMLRLQAPWGAGGGDFTLLAVMVAWMPLPDVLFATAAGCLLWLPVTCLLPRRDVPLGVPLILGWVAFSLYKGLPFAF